VTGIKGAAAIEVSSVAILRAPLCPAGHLPHKEGDWQVAPIDRLSVVLVAVFGAAFLGERLSGANWLGVALIAAGAVLVVYLM
jgi:hypothetical protein